MPTVAQELSQAPRAIVFYHFFPPDSVVSATLFGQLGAGLVERGWIVSAYPSNRSFTRQASKYSRNEIWNGINIRRLWRPNLAQSSALGRVVNALWMVARWSLMALNPAIKPDVLIVGTDPILSVLIAPVWRLFKPKTKIAHWCFDLYPEAAVADGLIGKDSRLVRTLYSVLKKAYAACDLIVVIGECMEKRLRRYGSEARVATCVTWALEESNIPSIACETERNQIFGSASLSLMYSGSFGRAHSFNDILLLARYMKSDDMRLAFSVQGNCEKQLRAAVLREDHNISFVPYADPRDLFTRLSAADVHVVSLRDEWTGTVVPSKFFGALAVGRPVLYSGSRDSAIARWIDKFKVGWVLTHDSAAEVANELRALIANPAAKRELNQHCHRVYQRYFAKQLVLDLWDAELRDLIQRPRATNDNPSEPCESEVTQINSPARTR